MCSYLRMCSCVFCRFCSLWISRTSLHWMPTWNSRLCPTLSTSAIMVLRWPPPHRASVLLVTGTISDRCRLDMLICIAVGWFCNTHEMHSFFQLWATVQQSFLTTTCNYALQNCDTDLSVYVSEAERPTQHIISHLRDGFCRPDDPTNSVRVLKEASWSIYL